MTIAMMIDIETLSLRPNAHVTQIGYCVADLDSGEYLVPATAWRIADDQNHTTIDFDTVKWWMQQDKDVVGPVFGFGEGGNRYPEAHSMTVASEIVGLVRRYGIEEVWASPAMFDLPILTHLWYGAKPWKYDQERCMMTLYKRIDPDGTLAPPPNKAHHDAAADAQWQMDYLINLHKFMRDNRGQATLPLWEGVQPVREA